MSEPTGSAGSAQRVDLVIEGMTCDHCVRAVRGRLERTPGVRVEQVTVGAATIHLDPTRASMSDVEDAISDEGYTVDR